MRKIERIMVHAVLTGRNMNQDNTKVVHTVDRAYVYLHGHNIAQVFDDYLIINDCGWQTVTTKSRLNALLHELGHGAGITQRSYAWYLLGTEQGTVEMNSREWYYVPSPATASIPLSTQAGALSND